MATIKLALLILGSVTATAAARSVISPVTLDVDFSAFLSRHDPVWAFNSTLQLPKEWVSSLFGGNGDLGFMMFAPELNLLRVQVNRQTLWDDRTPDLGEPYYLNNFVFDQPRLPCGHFDVTWGSGLPVSDAVGRVSIYDARATMNITTPAGSCSIAVWASAAFAAPDGADVIVIETTSTGAESCVVRYVSEISQSTWSGRDSRYVPNPTPLNSSTLVFPTLQLNFTTQPHLPQKGTFHTVAVLTDTATAASTTYYFTVSPTLTSQMSSESWASGEVYRAQQRIGLQPLRAAHEAWWHAWWPAGGFIAMEYTVLESMFYLQLFKFASGARAGRTVHDLMGPWVRARVHCLCF